MRHTTGAIFLLALARGAFAQIGGPALGLVPDGQQIRAMYGMAAAGAVGPAIASGLSNIAISPAQNFAIAMNSDGAAVLVLPSGSITPIVGTASNPGQIAISPAGTAAGLWIPSTSHFEVVTQLPGAASVLEVDASAFGLPIAFAVSDDGHLAASFASGVEMFGTDGSAAAVGIEGRVIALAFFSGSTNLAAATATTVSSIVNGTPAALYQAGAAKTTAIRSMFGIAVSSDGRFIVAALGDAGLVSINVASGASSNLNCGCRPAGVFSLGGTVFRLTNTLSNGGVVLLNASSGSFLDVPPGGQQ